MTASALYERCRYLLGRLRGLLWALAIRRAGGQCGGGLWIGRGVVWKYAPHTGIQFASNVQLGEYCILDVPSGGQLQLGNAVKFSMGCVVAARERISVGDDSLFGEYCSIRDADHGMALNTPMHKQPMVTQPVAIGCDTWIGRGVAVLRGAHIGNGVVVGANSLVKAGYLAVMGVFPGSPCRLLKSRQ